ncbi:hypothetical protein ACIBAI_22545 [Streptomyces sp. NPDC051041]|uniref:hypothetical protein n=1 Tax=Streptomyces sp. NPDC051041 TaxID=3365640 RepID=UPI0037B707F7
MGDRFATPEDVLRHWRIEEGDPFRIAETKDEAASRRAVVYQRAQRASEVELVGEALVIARMHYPDSGRYRWGVFHAGTAQPVLMLEYEDMKPSDDGARARTLAEALDQWRDLSTGEPFDWTSEGLIERLRSPYGRGLLDQVRGRDPEARWAGSPSAEAETWETDDGLEYTYDRDGSTVRVYDPDGLLIASGENKFDVNTRKSAVIGEMHDGRRITGKWASHFVENAVWQHRIAQLEPEDRDPVRIYYLDHRATVHGEADGTVAARLAELGETTKASAAADAAPVDDSRGEDSVPAESAPATEVTPVDTDDRGMTVWEITGDTRGQLAAGVEVKVPGSAVWLRVESVRLTSGGWCEVSGPAVNGMGTGRPWVDERVDHTDRSMPYVVARGYQSPVNAPAPTGTVQPPGAEGTKSPGPGSTLQELIDGFGGRVTVGHIGAPQPAPAPSGETAEQPSEQPAEHPGLLAETTAGTLSVPAPEPADGTAGNPAEQAPAADGDGYGTADLFDAYGLAQPERIPAPAAQDEPGPRAEAEESTGVPDGQMTVEEVQPEAPAGQEAPARDAATKDDGRERLTSADGRLTFTLNTVPANAGFHREAVEGYQRLRSELAAVVAAKDEQAAQTPAEQADQLARWRRTYKAANRLEPFRPLPALRLTKRTDAPGLTPAEYGIGSWVTWRDDQSGQQVTGQVMAPGAAAGTWYVSTDRTGHTGEYHVLSRSGKKATGYSYSINGATSDLRPAGGPGEQRPLEDLPEVDSIPARPVTSYADYVPSNGLAPVREPIPVTVGETGSRFDPVEVAFDVVADGIPFVVKVDQDDETLASTYVPRVESADGDVIVEFDPLESRAEAIDVCVRVARETRERANRPLYAHYRNNDFALAGNGVCGRCSLHIDDSYEKELYRVNGGDPECIDHIVLRLNVREADVAELALARRIWATRQAPEPADTASPTDAEQSTEAPAERETTAAAAPQEPHEVDRKMLRGGDRITAVVNASRLERPSPWGQDVPGQVRISGTVHPGYRNYQGSATLLDAVIRDMDGNELAADADVFVSLLPARVTLIPAGHRDELRPETRIAGQIRVGDLIAEGGKRGEVVTELRFAHNAQRGTMMMFSTRDVASGSVNGFTLAVTDEIAVVPRERRPAQDITPLFGRHGSHDQVASEVQRTFDLWAAVADAVSRAWPNGTGPQGEIRALNRAVGAIDTTGRGVDGYRANAAAMEIAEAAAAALFAAADDDLLGRYVGLPLHRLRQHLDAQAHRLHASAAHLATRAAAAPPADTSTTDTADTASMKPGDEDQPAPDRPTDRTQEGGSVASRSETEQLGLFGALAPDVAGGQAEPDTARPASADGDEAALDDAVRAQLAVTEVTGAAGIRYSLHGSMRPGEPESIQFRVVRLSRGVTGTYDFSGTRDECLAYIGSEAAVRSAAEAVGEDREQRAAALAWLREARAEEPAADAPAAAELYRTAVARQRTGEDERTPDAPEESGLPELDVVLLDVDVPSLDPAEPYATDAEAQADIDRLGEAFARWAALPAVQRYHDADRQRRPDGDGAPTNPIVQLAEAYRDAERTLREGPVGSPDDLVRQVYAVAAWSGALEAVVGDDLRGPLGQVREATRLLASRSRVTVESFEAELAALAANSEEQSTDSQSAGVETESAEQDAAASPAEQAPQGTDAGETEARPGPEPGEPAADAAPVAEPPASGPETATEKPLFAVGDRVYLNGERYSVSEVSEDGTILRSGEGVELPAAEVTYEQDMPPVTSERLADGWWRYSYRDRTYTVTALPDDLVRGRLATLSYVIVDENNDLVGRSFGTPTDRRIIWAYHNPGVLPPDVVRWWRLSGSTAPLPEYTAAERAYVEAGPPTTQTPLHLDAPAQTTASTETDTVTDDDAAVPEPGPQDVREPAPGVGGTAAVEQPAGPDEQLPPAAEGEQQVAESGPAAAPTDAAPAGGDALSDETAQDASEEPTMTTPPIPETIDAPDEPAIEEPPAPQRYVETVALAGDTGYGLRLSGLDGQPVDSGDVLRGDSVIATVHPGSEGGWFARLTVEGLPADVTYLTASPQDAAVNAAVMYSAFTGIPAGPPLGAAAGDGPRQRVDTLRANLRDAAVQHREAVAAAAARAYPAFEQHQHFRELVGGLDGLAAAVSEGYGSQQMTQHLDAVQRAVNNWGGSLPGDPDHPERRQLVFPLAHLLYDSRRLQDQVQATLAAVQAERAAARDQAAAAAPGPEAPAAPENSAAAPEARQAATEPGSPAVPDSQSAETAREKTPAAPAGPADVPSTEIPASTVAPEGDGPAPDAAGNGIRRALEDALQASRPETAAQSPGELPLWTGTETSSADTAATEPVPGPLDVRAEFQAVMEAFAEHVPPQNGTAQDLVADLDADLATLQRAFAEAVAPPAPAAPPSPAQADTAAAEPEAETAAPVPQQADAVSAALQRADAHAAALQGLPEWEKIQTVRGAVGHLFRVMRERAGEHFDRLMGDNRVGEFFRKVSIRACEKVAQWAQAAADRLRRKGEGKDSDAPAAGALRDLADAATAYSSSAGGRSGPPPASREAASITVDIPAMRQLGEALSRPLPGAKDGRAPRVSTAAARGRSTTRRGAKKPSGSAEQAGHLRRGSTEQQRSHKPTQR